MLIKNRNELATTPLRLQALQIVETGIERVFPETVMRSALNWDSRSKHLDVQGFIYPLMGRIFVIGGGKAAGKMAEALENIVGSQNIIAGTVNCKSGKYATGTIKVLEAGHPIPDQRGVQGVRQMLALKDEHSLNRNDLVICLISGGGSALMPCPADGLSLRDKQRTTALLLDCGAEINEINMVRKHLSKTKGGRLGEFYSPARVVSLIISDVVGDDLGVIASGPTSPDCTTFKDAIEVLEKYTLMDTVPLSVAVYLRKGSLFEIEDTPKHLANCDNYLIGNNHLALEAMKQKAKELGFNPYLVTSEQKGDSARTARLRAEEIASGRYKGYDAILLGGETTLKLPVNRGKGGRNQHYTAVSLLAMKPYPGEWVVASVGTDGSDYLPDVAGAMVDNNTLGRMMAQGIDAPSFIDRFDSHTLFRQAGGSLVLTGDTGTNVGDVIVYLLK